MSSTIEKKSSRIGSVSLNVFSAILSGEVQSSLNSTGETFTGTGEFDNAFISSRSLSVSESFENVFVAASYILKRMSSLVSIECS